MIAVSGSRSSGFVSVDHRPSFLFANNQPCLSSTTAHKQQESVYARLLNAQNNYYEQGNSGEVK